MLLLALCSMVFVSCSDDDDEDGGATSSSIVGTWVSTEQNGRITYTSTVTFNADGTFVDTEETTGESTYKFRGTYSIKGNKITMTIAELLDPDQYDDEEWHKLPETKAETGTFEIKGDKLYLTGGEDGTVVFTRK